MRKHLPVAVLLLLASVGVVVEPAGVLRAQMGSPTEPLQRGSLTVWIAAGPPLPLPGTPALDYAKYHEDTVGGFGQNAGPTSQTAGSYGQTSGSLGTSAGNLGQTAGSIGQTAGSFGRPAGEIGQTAGSYGQDVGDPIGNPIGRPAPRPAQPETATARQVRLTAAAWKAVTDQLQQAFSGLRLHLFTVDGAELRDRLAASAGTPDFPDALLGDELLTREPGAAALRDASLAKLGEDTLSGQLLVNGRLLRTSTPLVLRRAPHPEEARAFLFWLDEKEFCRACAAVPANPVAVTAASVAVAATETLLRGGTLGGMADPAMAQVSGELVRRMTLLSGGAMTPESLVLRTEVRSAVANARLAVVGLRVTAAAENGFGVLHPVAVLRKGSDGGWRVLQLTADVRKGEMDPVATLGAFAGRVAAEKLKPVTAVTLAAPVDGDSRVGLPELWWDNAGDAGLLAVEWQTRGGSLWSDTHLFFVHDRGSRLQVRVPAVFTHAGEEYRWRVWSVGEGGVLALSPWRRLTVLP